MISDSEFGMTKESIQLVNGQWKLKKLYKTVLILSFLFLPMPSNQELDTRVRLGLLAFRIKPGPPPLRTRAGGGGGKILSRFDQGGETPSGSLLPEGMVVLKVHPKLRARAKHIGQPPGHGGG